MNQVSQFWNSVKYDSDTHFPIVGVFMLPPLAREMRCVIAKDDSVWEL